MFLSEAAYYQAGKSIKGGAPICWPWFGPDPEQLGRPAHGFVRNRLWNVMETEVTTNGECKITLGLTDTPETQAIWPHSFKLSLEITVGESLNLELITHNPNSPYISRNSGVAYLFQSRAYRSGSDIGLGGDQVYR